MEYYQKLEVFSMQATNYLGEVNQYYDFLGGLDLPERAFLRQMREKEIRRKHWIKQDEFYY